VDIYERLSAAIDYFPVAVLLVNPDLTIRLVNKAFSALTGFSQADVAGATAPYPWWPPDKQAEYLAELNVVKTGRKHKTDWLFTAKDGHRFWVKANVAPVAENGQPVCLLAAWTDITDNMGPDRLNSTC
jgi:PAS domain S-box-containing protein